MTEARKVAAFRKRLASRKINWVIDIPVRRRITVELTRQQQQLLRRVTRQQIRSLTLAVYSDVLDPKVHALAWFEVGGSAPIARARRRRKAAGRAAR